MKSKIGIIGAGGLIGTALVRFLQTDYDITIIKSLVLYSEPQLIANILKDLDVIINLCGYPVSGQWSKKRKKLIYDSRVITTKNLVAAISLMNPKPNHLINASAVGIYSDFGLSDENSQIFIDNFLSKVVNAWEREITENENFGYDFTILRIGVVLSRFGGAYPILRKVFRMFLGGKLGNGNQGFSFIFIDDLIEIVDFVIKQKMFGIVNAVAPNPTTNRILTKELGLILKRPAFFSVPALFIRIALKEGSITLLSGQKVIPTRLLERGFSFKGNNIRECLELLEK